MEKINAGVTLMQDFCRAESDVFSEYIEYVDREEAQRNTALSKFNLFNDYVGNPYKGSHLFTADKDWLAYEEKRELKDVFKTAQMNESVMWQTVISFDNAWLEKNGVYHSGHKMLDERKMYEVTRRAMTELLKREKLENAVWSAGIHYNTDNIHVHVAIVEPYPMRQKMLYEGKMEVRGKFKMSSIKSCRSAVVNELMQTKEINQKINFIIRKDIIEKLKERELSNDPDLQDKFLTLCQRLPEHGALNYNNRSIGPVRKQVDEISRMFLDKYCPEKYKEFIETIERQSLLYAEAYGGGNDFAYKEDKEYDLMQRMGNAVLRSAKEYMQQLNKKTEEVYKIETPLYGSTYKPMDSAEQKISVQESKATEVELESFIESVLEEMDSSEEHPKIDITELWISEDETGSPFKLRTRETDSQKAEMKHPEILEMEKYFEELNRRKDRNVEMAENDSVADIHGKYAVWYEEFKMLRDEINLKLRTGEGKSEEKLLNMIHQEAETNPFLKAMLGEMYMYGRITDISLEKSEKYFKDALDVFEKDVNYIPEKENKFNFGSYLRYRIGKQYERGWGTEYDPEVAAEWFEKSGTSYASFSLGNLYYAGEGVEQDFEKAFRCYQSAENNPFANLKVAQMYEKGIGVEQNNTESEMYFENAFKQFYAAEEKAPDAIFEYQLGNMLYYGKGCEKDIDRAIEYLEDAIKQKNVPATLLLSRIYMDLDMVECMPDMIAMLEELAGQGENGAAQYTLGNIYTNDWEFYDLKKGIEQYRKAAEQGNEYAQYQLGKLYINPELEIYDLQKGIAYLESAAEQGNEYAQYQLGKLYINQELEIYDLQKGIAYLESAAEQGNENAKYLLGKEYLDKSSVFYAPEKGVKYMKELAEQGNEFAQLKLGIEYLKGESVDRDLFSAREWLGKSAEQGNETAKSMLGNLFSVGGGQTLGKLNPMNEFDKALMELRKSLYKAQEETMKNLLIYEKELNEELEQREEIYI